MEETETVELVTTTTPTLGQQILTVVVCTAASAVVSGLVGRAMEKVWSSPRFKKSKTEETK